MSIPLTTSVSILDDWTTLSGLHRWEHGSDQRAVGKSPAERQGNFSSRWLQTETAASSRQIISPTGMGEQRWSGLGVDLLLGKPILLRSSITSATAMLLAGLLSHLWQTGPWRLTNSKVQSLRRSPHNPTIWTLWQLTKTSSTSHAQVNHPRIVSDDDLAQCDAQGVWLLHRLLSKPRRAKLMVYLCRGCNSLWHTLDSAGQPIRNCKQTSAFKAERHQPQMAAEATIIWQKGWRDSSYRTLYPWSHRVEKSKSIC